MIKLIILDRDGVINEDSDEYIKSPAEWRAIPGSLEAIAQLNKAGFKITVATNQSGIARGYFSLETLQAIHQKMQTELAVFNGKIDYLVFCPHGPDDECDCRKPKPGLLKKIADHFQIDLTTQALAIGDSLRDIEAAQTLNCPAWLVKTGKGEKTLQENKETLKNIFVFNDLAACTKKLCDKIN